MYKLKKTLYGQHQASREWYKHLQGILTTLWCKQSEADPAKYVLQQKELYVLSVAYVHDELLLLSFEKILDKVTSCFSSQL